MIRFRNQQQPKGRVMNAEQQLEADVAKFVSLIAGMSLEQLDRVGHLIAVAAELEGIEDDEPPAPTA
jgi:hypothetical protein